MIKFLSEIILKFSIVEWISNLTQKKIAPTDRNDPMELHQMGCFYLLGNIFAFTAKNLFQSGERFLHNLSWLQSRFASHFQIGQRHVIVVKRTVVFRFCFRVGSVNIDQVESIDLVVLIMGNAGA